MTTVKGYVLAIRPVLVAVSRKLGTDLSMEDQGVRVLLGTVVILLSGLAKMLVDKGVLDDQELQVYLNGIAADVYPPEPSAPTPLPPGITVQTSPASGSGGAPDATGQIDV